MTTDLKSLRAFLADKPTPPRPNPKRELSEASQEAIKLLKFAGITTLVIIAGLIAMAVVVSFPGASRALYGVAYWFNGINFSSLTSGVFSSACSAGISCPPSSPRIANGQMS